jgi:hypothetical protein
MLGLCAIGPKTRKRVPPPYRVIILILVLQHRSRNCGELYIQDTSQVSQRFRGKDEDRSPRRKSGIFVSPCPPLHSRSLEAAQTDPSPFCTISHHLHQSVALAIAPIIRELARLTIWRKYEPRTVIARCSFPTSCLSSPSRCKKHSYTEPWHPSHSLHANTKMYCNPPSRR